MELRRSGMTAFDLAEHVAEDDTTVLGRIGTPENVAAEIYFLLDPANSWITCQVLGVDGGLGSFRAR